MDENFGQGDTEVAGVEPYDVTAAGGGVGASTGSVESAGTGAGAGAVAGAGAGAWAPVDATSSSPSAVTSAPSDAASAPLPPLVMRGRVAPSTDADASGNVSKQLLVWTGEWMMSEQDLVRRTYGARAGARAPASDARCS